MLGFADNGLPFLAMRTSGYGSISENPGQKQGEKKVGDEHADTAGDNSLGGGAADALGTALAVHPLEAADESDDGAEDDRLDEADNDIVGIGVFVHVREVVGAIDTHQVDADEPTGEDADENGLRGEQWGSHDGSEEARDNQVIHRMRGESAEGIDLFGDFHGAEFGSNGGTDAGGKHQGGEDWAEFAAHTDADDRARGGVHLNLVELEEGLGTENHAGGGAGGDDDTLAFDADEIELAKEVGPIGAAISERAKGLAHHGGKLAQTREEVSDTISPRRNHVGRLDDGRPGIKQRFREPEAGERGGRRKKLGFWLPTLGNSWELIEKVATNQTCMAKTIHYSLIAGVCLAAAAFAWAQQTSVPLSTLPFSPAKQAGPTVYVSGQIPRAPDGKDVRESVEAETRQVMDNMMRILKDKGYTADDVVNATVYLKDLNDYQAMNKVYSSYFKNGFPARATVGGVDIVFGFRVEISCVAYKAVK